MLLASRGANVATRALKLPKPPNINPSQVNASRAIHIPTSTLQNRISPASLKQSARTLLSRFFSHITPNPNAAPIRLLSRAAYNTSAPAHATIKQSLSLPARFALGVGPKPLGTPFMPRSPVLVSRSVANVGLGTARNFSSARPVFQNIVQNVPVAARAFCEVDLNDVGSKTGVRARRGTARHVIKAQKKQSSKLEKTKRTPLSPATISALIEESLSRSREFEETDEMLAYSHYFSVAPEEPFTTTLVIPLAPEGARAPLPPDPFTSTYDIITDTHIAYSRHSIRVAALFRRLDAANVWERGAQCIAMGEGEEGVARKLLVKFDGWSEDTLRGVLGEAGTGWCEVVCVPKYPALRYGGEFVMPAVDSQYLFSSGYASHFLSGTTTPVDYGGDIEGHSDGDGSWTQSFTLSDPDSGIRMGFSSAFEERL